MTPTKIYVQPVLELMKTVKIRGVSHITGGGFYENMPRALRDGLSLRVEKKNVRRLPIFDIIQKEGKIDERDMYNTFNMGVGMCVTVAEADADRALKTLSPQGAYALGVLEEGEKGVNLL